MTICSTGISREERSAGGAMKPLAVTVNTACTLSGLGPTKVWGLIKEGRLEVVRIDRRTLVKFASLERLFDAAQHAPRSGRPRKYDLSQEAGE
jgi:hypothetical protein